MMTIYILRHGIAEDPTPLRGKKDSERALTAEGRQKLRRVARAMQAMELEFDRILSSPLVRARQTAEIVAEVLNLRDKLELRDELAVDGEARELIAYVKQMRPAPVNLLLVGHEPYLSSLISLLLAGNPELGIILKKGGLGKLSVKVLRAGRCATLDWLLTPRQMGLMK
jgi:phosphohistidine phosphatase